MAIDIDISLNDDEGASAAPAPSRVQRPAYGAGVARPASSWYGNSSEAPTGPRLSLKEYKKRIEESQAS